MASLRLLHLNEDTSWHIAWKASADAEPFNIVLDPWLTGPQVDYVPVFSKQTHVIEPAFTSIGAIEEKLGPVGAIVNTIEYTDHTHEATLRTARPETPSFARRDAKKRIDGWKVFTHPPATIHQLKAGKDLSLLPETLAQLGSSAGWPKEQQDRLPGDVSLLWVPTDSWLLTGDSLQGVLVFKFDIPMTASDGTQGRCYTIMYSPHGCSSTAVTEALKALNALPHHQCLAFIHHFDKTTIPGVGVTSTGIWSDVDLVNAIKPRFLFRTHDELKKGEGLIGKIMTRKRGSVEETKSLVDAAIQVRELHSGESVDLL